MTKIRQHTKKYNFCRSNERKGIILIPSPRAAIVVLALVIFFFYLTNSQVLNVLKNLSAHWLENTCYSPMTQNSVWYLRSIYIYQIE